MKKTFALCIVATLATPIAGCSVYDEPAQRPVVETYQPDQYEGNIVYFEDEQPYVIIDDEVRYVPRERVEYETLRTHYHYHSGAYVAWYSRHAPPRKSRSLPRRESRHEDRRRD